MENIKLLNWGSYRFLYLKWHYELSLIGKCALSLLMAGVTGILAQVRIPLPFTPVPITGQLLGVLLSGAILGRFYGGLSQIFYVGLGSAGIPWFAGFKGGLPLGPTGGYLIGFIFAALFVGWITEKFVRVRFFLPQLAVMMGGVLIIYFFGAVQFSVIMKTSLPETLKLAVLPFIGVDLLKSLMAAGISSSILPPHSYNEEVDEVKFSLKA